MPSRTPKQNRAYWKYLRSLADDLNDAGIDFKTSVRLPVRFTAENMHEYMFTPVMQSLYPDKQSTTELSTVEMQEVYDTFNAAVGQRVGVSRDWPSNR